jgi:hypothetical protein
MKRTAVLVLTIVILAAVSAVASAERGDIGGTPWGVNDRGGIVTPNENRPIWPTGGVKADEHDRAGGGVGVTEHDNIGGVGTR